MMKMRIALGTDHRGFALKELLKQHTTIGDYEIEWVDCGAYDDQRSDYPLFAHAVGKKMKNRQVDLGILLCGTGIGMAIVANRYQGIFAGLVWNSEVARLAREDDNCNVLVIPADFVQEDEMLDMVHAWLHAEFKGGRYAERLAMIDE